MALKADAGTISLYVHVPFCATKCPYCDFNTYASIEGLMEPYVGALCSELRFWGEVLRAPAVSTVFFGGGTPSYLGCGQLSAVMETVRGSFDLARGAEITAEANPDDLTGRKLDELASAGVNRLSVGVQSLDDGLLATLGRRHSAAEAESAVARAARAGFENLSIDLMYGLPAQTLRQWTETLARALELGTAHVSMYALTLEEGTPLARSVGVGEAAMPDPDLAADMYVAAEKILEDRGFRHYEISNWCLAGRESRHNLAYWLNRPFLGVGPGAHSYLGRVRFSIMRSPREYTVRLSAGNASARDESWPDLLRSLPFVDQVTEIDRDEEMAETMMMGLRLDAGVSESGFRNRFGRALTDVYGPTIDSAEGQGLVEWREGPDPGDDRSVCLTARGRLLGNEVFSRFFEPSS